MNQKLTKFINEKQLVSVMNKTKWCELAEALYTNPDFEPEVWLKYVLDNTPNSGYSFVDWECIKRGNECSYIEWMIINPVKSEYQGRLVDPKETDYSSFVEFTLKSCNIPYSMEDGKFKVWGYVYPGSNPEYITTDSNGLQKSEALAALVILAPVFFRLSTKKVRLL